MALAPRRDQRRDLGLGTGRHVRLAEDPAVRQQGLGLAQRLGQPAERCQHRRDLLLVVGGLGHSVGHHHRLPVATAAWAL